MMKNARMVWYCFITARVVEEAKKVCPLIVLRTSHRTTCVFCRKILAKQKVTYGTGMKTVIQRKHSTHGIYLYVDC